MQHSSGSDVWSLNAYYWQRRMQQCKEEFKSRQPQHKPLSIPVATTRTSASSVPVSPELPTRVEKSSSPRRIEYQVR